MNTSIRAGQKAMFSRDITVIIIVNREKPRQMSWSDSVCIILDILNCLLDFYVDIVYHHVEGK